MATVERRLRASALSVRVVVVSRYCSEPELGPSSVGLVGIGDRVVVFNNISGVSGPVWAVPVAPGVLTAIAICGACLIFAALNVATTF